MTNPRRQGERSSRAARSRALWSGEVFAARDASKAAETRPALRVARRPLSAAAGLSAGRVIRRA